MKNKIIDLIDFKRVNVLLEGFNKTTGFISAILDLEGNVLSQSGWRQICTQFHRVNPKTANKCKISDTELANKMAQGEKYHFYKCLNGLVDVAIPIVVNKEHIANLFTGQFFLEKPDYTFFKNQARKYGFDEKKYLDAMHEVPLLSEEEVKIAMGFLSNMTELIVQLTYQQLEQRQAELALKQNQNRLLEAERIGRMGNWVYEVSSEKIDWSAGMYAIYGRNKETDVVTYESLISWIHPEDREAHNKYFERMLTMTVGSTIENLEYRVLLPNGKINWVDVRLECKFDEAGKPLLFLGTVLDISERKRAETKIIESESNLYSLINNSQDFIWSIDRNFKYIIFNKAYAEFFLNEYGFDVKKGMDAKKQLNAEEYNFWIPMYKSVFAGEKKVAEFSHDFNGVTNFFQLSLNPIYEDGIITGASAINLNITKRKKAELDLAQNTNLLNDLIDNSSALIYIVDTNGRFISVNTQFEKLFASTRNEIIGKKREEIMPKEIAQQHLLNDQKVLKTKNAIYIEEENLEADVKHYYQTQKFPLFDAENNIYAIGGISTDITERKKAEIELLESKSFFEQLFIQSSTSTQLLDNKGWCVKINPKLTELFGVLPEHIEGKKYNILKDDEIIKTGVIKHLQKVFEKKETVKWEVNFDIKHASESTGVKVSKPEIKWFSNIAYPILDNHGELIYVIIQHEDITTRKQAEAQLKISEERFNLAVKGSNDGIWDWDNLESDEYWWSDRIYEILGYKPGDVEARVSNWKKWMHPDDSDAVLKLLNKHLEKNVPYQVEFRIQKKDGNYVWVAAKGETVRDNNGQPTRMAGSFSDITERKLAEEEIKKHRKNLEELVKERTLELETKISEIQRMNKLFVGRELRMKELKEKINKLDEELKNKK